ncbi:hypothetical protein CR513_57148, partial [Mucuna pruriens]
TDCRVATIVFLNLSNPSKLHAYDQEIDRTFHKLIRSFRSSEVTNCSLNSSVFASDFANSFDFDYDIANFDSNFGICISKFSLDNMVDNNRTLKELTRLEFHVIFSTMRPHGILEDYIKMKAFPFSPR